MSSKSKLLQRTEIENWLTEIICAYTHTHTPTYASNLLFKKKLS